MLSQSVVFCLKLCRSLCRLPVASTTCRWKYCVESSVVKDSCLLLPQVHYSPKTKYKVRLMKLWSLLFAWHLLNIFTVEWKMLLFLLPFALCRSGYKSARLEVRNTGSSLQILQSCAQCLVSVKLHSIFD